MSGPRALSAMALVLALGGCASLESTPTASPGEGLVYYLPKKDIRVTVTRDNGKVTTAIGTTAAYPDTTRAYVLKFRRNLIGRNELAVKVSPAGLLDSATSTTTSSLTEVIREVAGAVGTLGVRPLGAGPRADGKPACMDGSTSHVYSPPQAGEHRGANPCGLSVAIRRISVAPPSRGGDPAGGGPWPAEQGAPGVFYRQNEAYLVTITSTDGAAYHEASDVVLSPSLSPVRFLPIEKTLFSNNKAALAFIDGVPQAYGQEADGELVGLAKLPAEVIGAYFAAVGKVFENLKGRDDGRGEALAAQVRLEIAKEKHRQCLDAIRQKDDASIAQLECRQ